MPKRGKKCRTSNNNTKVKVSNRRGDKCDNVNIGTQNINRWNTLKLKLGCKTNEEFATYLLDLAIREKGNQIYSNINDSEENEELPTINDSDDSQSLNKNIIINGVTHEKNEINKSVTRSCAKVEEESNIKDESFLSYTEKKIKTKKTSVIVLNDGNLELENTNPKINSFSSQDCEFNNHDLNTKDNSENSKLSPICDSPLSNENEILKSNESNKNTTRILEDDKDNLDLVSLSKDENTGNLFKVKHLKKVKNGDNVKHLDDEHWFRHRKRKRKRSLSKKHYNGIETPNSETPKFVDNCFEEQIKTIKSEVIKTELQNDITKPNNYENDEEGDEIIQNTLSPRVAITIKLCSDCDLRHVQNACPLLKPVRVINDAVTVSQCQWLDEENKYKTFSGESMHKDNEDESVGLEMQPSFAELTLPELLELRVIDSAHGLSVVTKEFLPAYVEFGPLIGQPIKEMEIPDDFLMKDIWEICNSSQCTYLSTQDPEHSNWLRWVRPAPIRNMRNVAVISRNSDLIFVTITAIEPGEELLFWAENRNTAWSNKNLCKISCGGCNLRFSHTLYYRLHCAVFHHPNFSLTIRKYHCKVCGISVLGKENIMKHAADSHDGRGAYQCQFCKKFFLRLNYLEMHRTYGCSANPHRARPLCDYCGRKFSQPQKLKVHIKRMHSDMSEVLKEFQCKRCLKLLGSRAALQRHNKEVHCKDIVRACTCDRCGKMFQNKSNLKIHMLTHSGIKPFRCAEEACGAAFTTKQCLQFHYKKVHGFDKTKMPNIKRSVAYTFDAYAGGSRPNSVNSSCSRSSSEGDDMEKYTNDQAIPSSPQHPSQDFDTPVQSASVEVYNKMVISKGSKKWMGHDTIEQKDEKPDDVFEFDEDEPKSNAEILNKNEPIPMLFHHCKPESSNASLLVEAALNAAERDIDINSGPIKLPSPQPILMTNKMSESLYPTLRSHLVQSPTHQVLSRSISPTEYSVQEHNHSPHLVVDSGYPTSISPRHSNYNLMFPDRTPHYELRFSPSAGQMDSFHLDESRYDLHHRRTEENSSDESNNVAQNLSLGLKGKSLQLDLSAAYKYEGIDERSSFEPLEGLDMSRSSNYHHSSFVSMPPRYPHTLYEQRPYSHTDVLRVVNLTHSVDLSLPRNLHHQLVQPTNQSLMDPIRVISPPPTYQSYSLSPSSYLTVPRSTHSPTYHHYSGY